AECPSGASMTASRHNPAHKPEARARATNAPLGRPRSRFGLVSRLYPWCCPELLRALAAVALVLLTAGAAWARVAGGEAHRGGGGGAGDLPVELIYLFFRLVIWLNVDYPAIGVPLDILIVVGLIWLATSVKNAKAPPAVRTLAATPTATSVPERLEALRQPDP